MALSLAYDFIMIGYEFIDELYNYYIISMNYLLNPNMTWVCDELTSGLIRVLLEQNPTQ